MAATHHHQLESPEALIRVAPSLSVKIARDRLTVMRCRVDSLLGYSASDVGSFEIDSTIACGTTPVESGD